MKERTVGPMSRADGMAARRAAIFVVAETFIRENQSTDFSMRGLAEKAGFSTTTTYNLIGSKATILYHLLSTNLAPLFSLRSDLNGELGSAERILATGALAVDFFVRDAGFFRPLFQHLLGVPDAIYRPLFMAEAYSYWEQAIEELDDQFWGSCVIRPSDVARAMHVFFIGALDLWVHEELTPDQFKAQIQQGIVLQLLGLAPQDQLATLIAAVAETKRIIP